MRPQAPRRFAPISALMTPAVFILSAVALAEPPATPPSAASPVREVEQGGSPAATGSSSPVRRSTGPIRRVDTNAEAGPLRDNLEVVDPGTEDVGALGTSFRQPSYDIRLPTGFQRVYRVPGEEDKLMRGNGALFAVFPESVYRRTARGIKPVAPPGTVYHIGMPGELHLSPDAPSTRQLAPGQIDGRVTNRIGPETYFGAPRVDTRLDGRHPTPADAAIGASFGDRVRADAPTVQATPIAPTPDAAPATPYSHLGFGPARVERE